LTVPEGVTVEEIRRNAVLQATRENGKTVYKLQIAPAEILVVDLKGIRIPAPVKSAAFKIKPVSGFRSRIQSSALPYDGYRFDPVKYKNSLPKTPKVIGCWKAADGFKDSSGNGHDLKLNNVRLVDGSAFWETSRSFAMISFPAVYPIDEGTYEMVVKPAPISQWPKKRNGMVRGGVFYCGPLMLDYFDGYWSMLFVSPPRYIRIQGPKGKAEWTHLAVTFKNSYCRFFVNGKEITTPDGPVKSMQTIGKDTFYNRVNNLCFGSLSSQWPDTFSFRGQIKECTFYGRSLTPEELVERAESAIWK